MISGARITFTNHHCLFQKATSFFKFNSFPSYTSVVFSLAVPSRQLRASFVQQWWTIYHFNGRTGKLEGENALSCAKFFLLPTVAFCKATQDPCYRKKLLTANSHRQNIIFAKNLQNINPLLAAALKSLVSLSAILPTKKKILLNNCEKKNWYFLRCLFQREFSFSPFVLVDTVSGFTRKIASALIFRLPLTGAEHLSKELQLQTESSGFVNVLKTVPECLLCFIKSAHFQQATAPSANHSSMWQSKQTFAADAVEIISLFD